MLSRHLSSLYSSSSSDGEALVDKPKSIIKTSVSVAKKFSSLKSYLFQVDEMTSFIPKIEIINHFDNLINRIDIDIEESH
jgi:hypothetical protein